MCEHAPAQTKRIGDPKRFPDLIILGNDSLRRYGGWGTYATGGLRAGNWGVFWTDIGANDWFHLANHIPVGHRRLMIFQCPVANIAVVDSPRYDFVVKKSQDGTFNSQIGAYEYIGLIRVLLYTKGQIGSYPYKAAYDLGNTNGLPGYVGRSYNGGDTMYVAAGWLDAYDNPVDLTDMRIGDKAVLQSTVNPYGLVWNDPTANNTEILPFRLDTDAVYAQPLVVVDWTAVQEQIPTLDSLKASRPNPGKVTTLTWVSAGETFDIMRNGQLIAPAFSGSTYVDNFTARPPNTPIYYSVRANNDFGHSQWYTVVAVKGK